MKSITHKKLMRFTKKKQKNGNRKPGKGKGKNRNVRIHHRCLESGLKGSKIREGKSFLEISILPIANGNSCDFRMFDISKNFQNAFAGMRFENMEWMD